MMKDFMSLTTRDLSPYDFRKKYGDQASQLRLSAYQDSWQFILPSLASKVLRYKTPWSQVLRVRDQLLFFLEMANAGNPDRLAKDVAGVEADWSLVREKLRYNAGMTRMMLDHGCKSRYLYKVIQQGAQAILLEVFHGRFLSVSGELEYYPYNDPLARYTVNESIAVNIQERTRYAQRELKRLAPGGKVLMCAAGLCPEVRLYGYPVKELRHEILAIDVDERNLRNLDLVFDRPLSEYGVEYKLADLWDICADPHNAEQFDCVLVQGFFSYCRRSNQTEALLEAVLQPLKVGGKLVFDIQLMRKDLVRCATSLGWESDLAPDLNAGAAVMRICDIVKKKLGHDGFYALPMYYGSPAAVLFTVTKTH